MADLQARIAGLSAQQREALELLLAAKAPAKETISRVSRNRGSGRFLQPSFAQQRLWFIDQLEPGSAAYNIPVAVRLEGHLDVDAFQNALNEIVRRHEILRTRYSTVDGNAVQCVEPECHMHLQVEDLTGVSGEQRTAAMMRRAEEEANTPFDLKVAPMLRAHMLRLGEQDHVLLLTMHHIASDGWSSGVLVREMVALYEAFAQGKSSPLPELKIQYADYAAWQRERLQGEGLEKQLRYWRKKLSDLPALELPTDHPRPPKPSRATRNEEIKISRDLAGRLQKLCRAEDATLFMGVLAAWQVVLGRWSGQEDVVVGTDVANRQRAELEGLIGFFVNQLVMRTDLAGNPSFRELLRRVRNTCMGAYDHQDVPFERVVEELAPDRDLSRNPLFQVIFVWQNMQQGPPQKIANLKVHVLPFDPPAVKFDLKLTVSESEHGLYGAMSYSTDLFEASSMRRMLRQLERVLEQMAANPEQRLAEVDVLDEAERQLLLEWTQTSRQWPPEVCAQQMFEEQAEKRAAETAVVCEEQKLSYQELNRRANQLGHYLAQLGVGPEMRVGICMERSVEMVVAILAVLKAGGAYVPLEPGYPVERLGYMVENAQAAVLLTQERLRERLPVSWAQVISVDQEQERERIGRQSGENLEKRTREQNLAYVIYTSGSTGEAKGVGIEHRQLVNYVRGVVEEMGMKEGEKLALVSTFAADLGNTVLYPSLCCGGELHVISAERAGDGRLLGEYFEREKVECVKITPSQLKALLSGGGRKVLPCRRLVLGGEAWSWEWLEELGAECEVMNHYGPTECTVGAVAGQVERNGNGKEAAAGEMRSGRSGNVPLGRPLKNVQVYVLDTRMKPVGVGMKGELYIGGAGVGRGYLQRAGMTADRFIPDGFSGVEGARLYRTGDVVRWLEEGKLEYVGRSDEQVKIRGYRIEPGEVAAVLEQQSGVAEAVVVAREESSGEKRLVGYVVEREGERIDKAELRQSLQRVLPEYMVPSAIVVLEAMPLTANGKLDRRALPAPEWGAGEAGYEGPRTATEEMLAGIWGQVLGVERVGLRDNFFELGGHSLLAAQVMARVRTVLGVELPLTSLFQQQRFADFAQEVEQRRQAEGGVAVMEPVVAVDRSGPLELSFAQQRLWFIDQLEPGSAVYNIPVAVRLEGPFEVEAFQNAIHEIVRRHEVLRTRYETVDGRAVQCIEPEWLMPLQVEDLSGMEEAEREAEAHRRAEEEGRTPFDLKAAPMLRARVLRLAEQDHVLLLTMHHIASDGWSSGVLVREMVALYQAHAQGTELPLPELKIQYADYAAWQRKWLQGEVLDKQLRYWREQLAELPTLELPTDRPRPVRPSRASASEKLHIRAELKQQLQELCRAEGVTLFMALLAAWQVVLGRWSGQEDVVVGTDVANRRQAEVEGLIGFFVNQLVMRTNLSGNPSFREVLERVRNTCMGAYDHQDLPFERVVEDLNPTRSLQRSPLFQVKLILQNTPSESRVLSNLALRTLETASLAKFDLLFSLADAGEELHGTVAYSTELFDRETVRRLIAHFEKALVQIASNLQMRVWDLPLVAGKERRQLLVEWNDTAVVYAGTQCLHKLIERQAACTPDSQAVVFEETHLTYRQLNERANQLARHLARQGVRTESVVAVFMERSLEMVVSLLAVLKAGGAYLPLDPAYPSDRLAYMLKEANVKVLLTQAALQLRLPPYEGPVVSVDEEWNAIAKEEAGNPENRVALENIAYVIYTSGSTGNPKGVMISHEGICNRLLWMQQQYGLTGHDRVLQKTPYSFDVSVWEFFWPLFTGAQLVVARPEGHRDTRYLVETIQKHGITTLHFVPSMLRAFLAAEDVGSCTGIKRLFCSGEALDIELCRNLKSCCTGEIHNLYGPTEASVDVSYWQFHHEWKEESVPIGKPVANTRMYVLDRNLEPAPIGVTGELYLGGVQLARGYLNRPELTAERFVPNPFSAEGERLYRTGDLARYRNDGNVEYLGRADHQVKIRGYRIELAEIETLLSRHSGVSECAVIAREDRAGEKRLVAYVVADPAQEAQTSASELRSFLRSRLPEYMTPAAIVFLKKLPLSSNGKLDRRALPAPEAGRAEWGVPFEEPRTTAEKTLSRIWEQALGVERLGIHDNFFDLGGDSIRSIQVRAQAVKAGLDFSVQQLFQEQTIGRLAQVLTVTGNATAEPAQIAPFSLIHEEDRRRMPEYVEDAYPLTRLQSGMLFHSEFSPDTAIYHDIFSYHLRTPLNVDVFAKAVQQKLAIHPVLRTSFDLSAYSEPLQLVHRRAEISVGVEDLIALNEAEQEKQLQNWIELEKSHAFDMAQPGMLRFHIHRRSQQSFQFTLSFHHIILDGWSVASFLTELFRAYFELLENKQAEEQPLASAFRDFVAEERATLQSAEARTFWERQLADFNVARLPWKAVEAEARVGALQVPISEETSQGLKALAQRARVPLKTVALAAHLRVINLLSGQQDVLTGVLANGRPETKDGERVLGLFLNTLPFRITMRGGRWIDLIQTVFAAEQSAVPFRRYPLTELQRAFGTERLFRTSFNFIHFHVYRQLDQVGNMEVLGHKVFEQTNFDLIADFVLDIYHSNLQLRLDFNASAIGQEQIEAISRYYSETLAAMVRDSEERYESARLLAHQERQQLLLDWNNTRTGDATPASLPELFAKQVEKTPNHTALIYNGHQLTYTQLNQRANRLGRHLQSLGVGPEQLVGICVERSIEMVVGILGVLKAGGAYVPLDPKYPAERLAFILEDSAVPVLLTQSAVRERLPVSWTQIVSLDEDWPEIEKQPDAPFSAGVDPANAAYVIYTSGSTGRPKGVVVSHNGIASLSRSQVQGLFVTPESRVLQFASLSFDASVYEIVMALTTGAALILLDDDKRSGAPLREVLAAQRVTHATLPPTVLATLESGPDLALESLVVAGEACSGELVAEWSAGRRMINAYGPTETTVCATMSLPLSGSQTPHIGFPVCNTQVYVLDANFEPVPVGVIGELYVAGFSLARGYWKQPAMTAERFVPNPFGDAGERLYRTGDLGCWQASGALEFLGRADHQVKIRGYRIELGEIESALNADPAVSLAVVMPREDRRGQKRLVAYVVPRSSMSVDPAALRESLAGKLPDYMVPAAVMVLESLPLTPNGKVDYKALPSPEMALDAKVYRAPRTEAERILCEIWAQVLGLDRVSVQDNFFEIGGDSILSIQVLALARKAGLNFTLQQLFERLTIERLTQVSGIEIEPATLLQSSPFSLISSEDKTHLPDDVEDAYPIGAIQAGMLFHTQFSPESAVYHNIMSYHVRARLDVEALRNALNIVVRRHPVLRTSFHFTGYSQPLQLVHREVEISLSVDDVSHLPEGEQDLFLGQWVEAEKRRGFDITRPGLLRFHIHKRSEDSFQFAKTEHHAILDGWSEASLLTELFKCYFVLVEGKEWNPEVLASSFRDFIALEMQVLESGQARAFWKQMLADVTAARMPWKADKSAPPRKLSRHVMIEKELSQALKDLAQRAGVPVKTVLLAAHMRVMSLISGQGDVITGLVSNGRPETSDGERVLGLFLNTLPFRMPLPGGRWMDLVEQTAKAERSLLPYRRFPLPELQLLAGHGELFEVAFNFTHFHVYRELEQVPGMQVLDDIGFGQTNFTYTADFSLDFSSAEVRLRLDYNSSLIEEDQMESIAGYYHRALAAMAANAQARYEMASLLDEKEKRQILLEWNDTAKEYCHTECMHQLFEHQAAKGHVGAAVVQEGRKLNYAELNERANQLAHYLRMNGVGMDSRVGICMPRSLEMMVAMLAVLKAGATYVPLDPAYPRERLQFMLRDSQASLVITQSAEQAEIYGAGVNLLSLESEAASISSQPKDNLSAPVQPAGLAYVIYTSGSTGQPKGVAIQHSSAVALLHWARDVFTAEELSGVLAATSICFDLSIFEIFVPLSWGGTVVLAQNALELHAASRHNAVTLANTVPSVMEEILRGGPLPASVHTINLAGEPLSEALVQRLYEQENIKRVFDLYGPSEDTTYSTFALRTWNGPATIGRPIQNTQAYVLDAHGEPAPLRVAGELYIGGAGLARGYLNRPELTAERFVPNPFSSVPGSRLYRTGDMASWRPDGTLKFLGRMDYQVKIRGFRIELGEIEAALRQCQGVREAAVVATEIAGDKRLVAYVTAQEEVRLEAAELRAALQHRLPDYMMPGAFVMLQAMPLTASGKLDRRALPSPDYQSGDQGYVAPRTATEEILVGIWASVLRTARVGIHDNFFVIGGHSLLATQVITRIRSAFAIELPLRRLFEHPTIAELSRIMEEHEQGAAIPEIRRASRETELPLSFAQQRLWFADQLAPGSPAYNIPLAVRLHGPLDLKAFQQTLAEIVRRHEVLRTRYEASEKQAVQRIEPECGVPFAVEDISGLAEAERDSAVREKTREEARIPFDLSMAPMLRARILRLEEQDHVLLLTMHHIASDGWSSRVLIAEMVSIYKSLTQDLPPLPELPVQYADYALWQREWLQGEALEAQLSYWREQLAGAPPLELPTDHPRPVMTTHAGAGEEILVPAALTAKLRELCRVEGVTLFMVLLAAWQVVLGRWAGQEDVVIGTDVANRRRPELENLIGFFVNQLVLRTDLSGNPDVRELLARVRKTCLGAYDHQDLPFERVVEELAPDRDLTRNPLFQAIFVWQNLPQRSQLEVSQLRVSPVLMETSTVRFDLTLTLAESGDELRGGMAYSVDLFEKATVRRMICHFHRVLEQIAANPEMRLAEVELLGEDERQLLTQWNQNHHKHSGEQDEAAMLLDELERIADEDVNELLKKSVAGTHS